MMSRIRQFNFSRYWASHVAPHLLDDDVQDALNQGACAHVSSQQWGEGWEEKRRLDMVTASPTRCVVITSGAPCAQDIASRLQALRHEHLTIHWRVPAGCAPCELVHCATLAPQRTIPPIHEDMDVHRHHAASRPT